MFIKFRPSLREVFGISLLGLFLSLTLPFYLVFDGWEKTILQSSETTRNLVSTEVARHVTTYLDEAPLAIDHFEKQVKYGLVNPRKVDSLEQSLLSLLLSNENISE